MATPGNTYLIRLLFRGALAVGLGSVATELGLAPGALEGGGSTRRSGVAAAGALGDGWSAGAGAVGAAVGDSRTPGARTAAEGPAAKAVDGVSAGVGALWLGSRGVFWTAAGVVTGTGVGATAQPDRATGAVAEAGSDARRTGAPGAALS
jgi:hypothetical protein